ncbi:MAG: carbamoyltransferase HypF, partial [Ekhidna sp.]|nr:carbamoyltransferase HypF [Ekhidna sp.]
MNGYQIHIKGRVQGVGFRPFVYNLAKSFHLNGSVRNTSSGVYIDLIADKFIADQFVFTLESNPPPKSIIESISTKPFEVEVSDDFRIVESTPSDKVDLKISPDFAMCSNCLDELESTTDRRARYAFITCSECGPRYSIQSKVPYDRFDTTMNAFHMCSACYEEYHDPSNRRFFSQTNSCGECGITLSLYDEAGQIEGRSQDELIDLACSSILKGKTVAVKGIGGYLLLCDPTNPDVLRTLRARKHRPDKPFALLFPDIDSISKIADIHEAEESLLRSEVSPIVILDRRENDNTSICWDLVSPDLPNAGVMLPYAPLLHLIAKRFDNGLIATSANISGGPILFKDDEARDQLFVFADLMLSHSREILIPQDDSVAKVVDGQVIWMRRSRGLAPSYFGSLPVHLENGILALGAHMKSSFALSEGNNWHVSQYLGSLDEYESQTT